MGAVLDRLMALPAADRNRFIRKEMTDEMALALLWDWTEMGRENQQPPLGEWRWWLVLAGRWWGKTRLGAEWINAKAREARKLGLQYRFLLVAETKADCRDVIAEGESGLIAKAPPWNRPKYEVSKRRLTWPDQYGHYSELTSPMGFLYSGEEPDQLRGPQGHFCWIDEWCFVSETPILTKNGWIPISQVTPGMLVLTRAGWRPVRVAGCTNPAAAVYRLTTTTGRTLTGTGKHPIWVVGRGFVPLQDLIPNDTLMVCLASSNGVENGGIPVAQDTSKTSRKNFSTALSMSTIMDPSQQDGMSIIRTVIRRTGIPIISKHSVRSNINVDTLSLRHRRSSGGHDVKQRDINAIIAADTTKAGLFIQSAFAQEDADSSSIGTRIGVITKKENVSNAEARFPSISTRRHEPVLDSVPHGWSLESVASVEPYGVRVPVWNLEVEDVHEYIAAGILASNCKYQYPVETMDNIEMALRLGDNPQGIITTTPRPLPMVREMLDRALEDTDNPSVVVTRGSSYDNYANISIKAIKHISAKYEGTRIGRQELHAEILEDVEGGFWTRDLMEKYRLPRKTRLPEMLRIAVAIDPATTSGEHANETGIMVGGLGTNGIAYLFEDKSGVFTPEAWGGLAISAYDEYQGDAIIGERNNGGDLVKRNIRACDGGDRPKIKLVWASRGKHVRAEPISSFHERGRIRFIGSFPDLEEQLVFYTPKGYEGESSPDRGDAFVWLMWFLLISPTGSSDPDDYADSQR